MRCAIMSFAHVHAEGYLRNLRANPAVELIGFADEDADRGKHFAGQTGARWFPTYEALIAEKPDGVIICSENTHHRALAERAAAAGIHVLSEKPLATTPEDAQAMVQACERAGVTLMTAFPMRFSAPTIEAKKVLDSGALGTVYGCNTTNQGQLPRLHSATRATGSPTRHWLAAAQRPITSCTWPTCCAGTSRAKSPRSTPS